MREASVSIVNPKNSYLFSLNEMLALLRDKERSLPGFVPETEALLFRQKDPKPLMPRLVSFSGSGAERRRSVPTRSAQTRATDMKRPCPLVSLQASEQEKGFQRECNQRKFFGITIFHQTLPKVVGGAGMPNFLISCISPWVQPVNWTINYFYQETYNL